MKKEQKTQYFQAAFKAIPVEKAEGITKIAAEEGGTIIKGYASTPTLDRYNDVVEPEAFRKSIVTNYRKNPIILFQHNPDRPVGKATYMSIDSKGLYIEAVVMDKEIEPKIKAGILQAFSIGFIPKEIDFFDDEGHKVDPDEDPFRIMFDPTIKRVIKDVDLVENSIVSVPANPDALFTMEKSLKSYCDQKVGGMYWEDQEKSLLFTVKKGKIESKCEQIVLKTDAGKICAIIEPKGASFELRGLSFEKSEEWTPESSQNWLKENHNQIKSIITKNMENLLEAKEVEATESVEEVEKVEEVEPKETTETSNTEESTTEDAEKAVEVEADETDGAESKEEAPAEAEAAEKEEEVVSEVVEGEEKSVDVKINPELITAKNFHTMAKQIAELKTENAEMKAAMETMPAKEGLMYSEQKQFADAKSPEAKTEAAPEAGIKKMFSQVV
jgi:HK97 family phage prohead protease